MSTWSCDVTVLVDFSVATPEQSMLPVGSIHINQLVAKRKADKEGREVLTDKWRLVVSQC